MILHNRPWLIDIPCYGALKARRQTSKKRCFEKDCSCDKAFQF